MTKRPELTFDGCGINGPDEYRTRVATFNRDLLRADPAAVTRYGKLFEQAPVNAAKLEAIRARIAGEFDNPTLMAIGPLSTNTLDDIQHILNLEQF